MPKPPLPKQEYKGRMVGMRMTEEEHKAWIWLAEKMNTTISKLWKGVLHEYYDRVVYPKGAMISGIPKPPPTPKIPKSKAIQKPKGGAIFRLD